jgi:hypothetical protein
MMSKKFIITVLILTSIFVSIYLIWTTWINPRPPEVAQSPAKAQPAVSIPRELVTIVPASLTKDGVPAKLGALSLTQTTMGADALAEFAQLHGRGFDLVSGYRANYSGEGKQATLWVGQAKDALAAEAMVGEMATKIGAGNAMFTNLQPLVIGERTLFSVDGQGQEHFFYASNDKIVWIAVDPSQALDALHSIWSAVK